MNYEQNYTIGIVGLGLMGASLAYALRGFRPSKAATGQPKEANASTGLHFEDTMNTILLGADADELVCRRAKAAGAVHEATTDVGHVMAQADLLLFCVYAHHIPDLIKEHRYRLKPRCVISDICGVKGPLYAKLMPLLPSTAVYVGVHPMAGKERDGFENADPALYHGSGFLITPTERSTPESVLLMKELASHIGATRLSVTQPQDHDALIAYTSDLMHIASAALCLHPRPGIQPAYTAGAFRDCTRVADINADAWAELLMDNRSNTLAALGQYLVDLLQIQEALCSADKEALRALLQTAGDHKRELAQR